MDAGSKVEFQSLQTSGVTCDARQNLTYRTVQGLNQVIKTYPNGTEETLVNQGKQILCKTVKLFIFRLFSFIKWTKIIYDWTDLILLS